ncbi:MAG: hypothetical protein MUF52_14095 [Syntrophobacteraceae bacterium]|jgi:protein-tyrosine phosphatase|nr:hypothetical protein [Syntrophobacteraceae bacterium]
MIDLHSHMLPGLDDGAVDWGQSLEMARLAVAEGIAGVVCTPHWVYGLYDNSRERVMRICDMLQQRLHDAGIPLGAHPGCEIRLEPDIPRKIASGDLLTLNDRGCHALIELPAELIPSYVENCFRDLMDRGITPILSHPERNPWILRHPDHLFRWVETGVVCQITAASLMGRFGPLVRRFTTMLIQHQMAHIMATDAHTPTARSPRMAEAVLALEALIGPEPSEKMVITNPAAVLSGERIHMTAPTPFTGSECSSALGWRRHLVPRC